MRGCSRRDEVLRQRDLTIEASIAIVVLRAELGPTEGTYFARSGRSGARQERRGFVGYQCGLLPVGHSHIDPVAFAVAAAPAAQPLLDVGLAGMAG